MNILEELIRGDDDETGKKFPNAPPERLEEMHSIHAKSGYEKYCFTSLEYFDNEICVDVYIWFDNRYKRFVLSPNARMTFKERFFFDLFCRETTVVTMRKDIQNIYNVFSNQKPEMHLRPYTNPMHMLHHIYCAMGRGTEEILYKANLGYLALYMDKIDDCNLIGTSPTAIFDGLSMKLLRSFDSIHGVEAIQTVKEREYIYELFIKKPILFQRKWSIGQCKYFKEVICARKEKVFIYDDYMILGFLAENRTREVYADYIRYVEKRNALKNVAVLPLWPKEGETNFFFYKADLLYENLILKRKQGDLALKRKYEFEGRGLEYRDDKFMVIWPASLGEFYREAAAQENCLWTYLEDVAYGATQILFMRKIEEPDKPYVTLEIRRNEIYQAMGKYNRELTEEEMNWLKIYADIKGLMIYGEEE